MIKTEQLFVPGSDKDARQYAPEDIMDILSKEKPDVKLASRRSESIGQLTYYINVTGGYLKTRTAAGTGSAMLKDQLVNFFGNAALAIGRTIDVISVRMGWY